MNPVLLYLIRPTSVKRLVIIVISIIILVVSLPVGAVLAFSNLPLLVISGGGGSPTDEKIFTQPVALGDTYDYGYCTYWVALRRIQIGNPIPNNWGDAITWNTYAEKDGYIIDHTPSFGAIFQWPEAPGGEGHVAFVENVDPNTGAWTISEMNAAGWDVVDQRTYQASAAQSYNFIHDKSYLAKNY